MIRFLQYKYNRPLRPFSIKLVMYFIWILFRTDEYSRFMKEYEETSKPRHPSEQKDKFYELKKKEQSDEYGRGI